MSRDQSGFSFSIGGFTPETKIGMNLIPLLDALGWKGSNTDILEALVDEPNKMNLDDLLKTMANLRFEGGIRKRRYRKVTAADLPCLCITSDNVYTLISGNSGGYQVFDGEIREYRYLEKLPARRKIVIFKPFDEGRFSFLKPQNGWFGQVLQRFRKEFSYTLLLSFLMTVFSFLTPLFVMLMYSQMQSADTPVALLYLGAFMAVFILAINGLKGLRTSLLIMVSERLGNLISNEVFRRLLYLSPQYTEIASVQEQTSRIRDFETIKSFFSGSAFTSLIDAPLALLILVGLFFIGGPLALIPLGSILIFGALAFYYYSSYQRISVRGSNVKKHKSMLSTEMMTSLSDIRTSGHRNVWFSRFTESSRGAYMQSQLESVYLQRINNSAKTISAITLVISISFSAYLVMEGQMTGGTLFASFLLISRLLNPIGSGFTVFSQFSKFQKSVKQLNRLMALPIEIRPQTIISLHKQMEGNILFRNVFLKYGKDVAPALMNISLKIRKGEILAVVGHGGSGKSSLLKLLLGMYPPLSGTILIDNLNLKQIDLIRLRKSIAYIPPKSFSFSGTIRSNLYIAKSDASKQQIDRALNSLELYDLIYELPEGLDTDLKNLPPSLDQPWFFKLLNFAQALLRDAPICLIDELEQGLSYHQISTVVTQIKEMRKTSTIVMVTTDSDLLAVSNRMLWLDNGRIYKLGLTEDLYNLYKEGVHSL